MTLEINNRTALEPISMAAYFFIESIKSYFKTEHQIKKIKYNLRDNLNKILKL